MQSVDAQFMKIIDACTYGERVQTRNSGCWRAIGLTAEFDSTPLVSIRKTAWKSALREWEWFMSGSNDINDLHESVRHWWQPWAKDGVVANNYSVQFRSFVGRDLYFDQIEWVIDAIKEHPFSRRNVITTWNPYEMQLKETPITNCHGSLIQFFGHEDGSLSMKMDQRSCDVVCGLPHNWIQYWAFLMWIAHRTGRKVGKFYWGGGDVHVYDAHMDIVRKMRNAMREINTPQLVYSPTSDGFKADDFSLAGSYEPVVTDKAEMIV